MQGLVQACTIAARPIGKRKSPRRDAGNYAGRHLHLQCGASVVEAAWRAVRMSPFWKAEYEKHLQRMRKPNQAIVVIARKLLIAIWHVLSNEETDIHATEEDLAYKMLLLSWSLSEDVRQGLTYKQFAKYALMQLGVETDITRFVGKDVPRRLAPREEVLARLTELGLNV
jgi:hypothetical protein